tara:strand:+ start:1502 stop:2575 length:1074 start_codon:yes stop_codon:yes gene_type:complete
MEEQSTNPRSIRLKQFIDTTGMSLSEFAKQCELSSITTIHQVVKHHKQPTDKVLKKIIKRFPQLSYDWILLGVGEMLVMGAKDNHSGHSVKTSTQATFSDISSKLEMHDHALNELNNVIKDSMNNLDKKMDLNVEIIASVNLKIDTAINNMNNRVNNFIAYLEEQNEKAIKDFEVFVKRLEESNLKNEKKLDKVVFDAKQYVEEHAKQNERGMNAALEMITGFDNRANAMMTKIEKMMDTVVKSQNRADARSEESLKAGMVLVESINKTREEGSEMIIAVQKEMKQQAKLAEEATELGYRALKENKEALNSFGKNLEGYAKERDKKTKEITLVNVEKLFEQLLKQKGLGTYTKVKKS